MPTLRERVLSDIYARQLARVEKVRESIALQEAGVAGLYPGEERLRREYLRLQEQQLGNLAEQRKQLASANAVPPRARLRPARERGEEELWRKSGIPRYAAILGYLERERDRSVELSRDRWNRAQALAARSRKLDLAKAYSRKARGGAHTFAPFEYLHGVDVDPCVEILAREQRRREVLIATGRNKGYRVSHYRRIC